MKNKDVIVKLNKEINLDDGKVVQSLHISYNKGRKGLMWSQRIESALFSCLRSLSNENAEMIEKAQNEKTSFKSEKKRCGGYV